MKKVYTYKIQSFFFCLFFCFFVKNAGASPLKGDSVQKQVLNMKGRISADQIILSDAALNVFIDSTTPFRVFLTDTTGICDFKLPLQQIFQIKITKPGYVTKIISADTHVPAKASSKYICDFSCDLFEEIEGLDVSILKSPIAKIIYDPIKGKFTYDSIYTAEINARVRKLYDDFHRLKRRRDSLQLILSQKKDSTTRKVVASDTNKVIKFIIPQQKISFFIQVFASKRQHDKHSALLKGLLNVKELYENGIYKYYTGEYADYNEAKKMRENIRKKYPGSFIIAFSDGKKISVKQALSLMHK